jgi:RNA-directed DNA polymerase
VSCRQGYSVVESFDTIPHRRLINAVNKRVADRNIRDLLWKFLRAGVMYREIFEETLTGTPQGGIVSPLLANIYLHELDRYMESNYLNLSSWKRIQRRERGKGNYLYVRYADDFVVLCNGTKAEALAMKEELKDLLSTMGLTLSEEKTKVTHITEGFNFLGYRIIRSIGTKGKMIPKVLIPEKAIKRFCGEVRRRLAPSSIDESTSTMIMGLNRLTRGWCEYYRCTSSPAKTFSGIGTELFWDMAHWLGRKYDRNMPAIMQRFRKDNTFGTSIVTLIMPSEYKAKRFVAKTWHNPYTEPEKVKSEKERITYESLLTYNQLWNGNEDRQGKGDLREEVILLKGTVCALNMPDICESKGNPLHPSEVEVDHITPRARFKDLTKADSMDNLQPVCTPCHRAKTKSDLKVLSRVR